MCLGAHGVISVASNLLPARLVNLVKLTLTKTYDAARNEHFKLLDLFQTLFIESKPLPIKAAMNLLEKPAGPCRLPLCDLSAQAETKLIHCLNKYSRFYHKIKISSPLVKGFNLSRSEKEKNVITILN